MQHIYISRHPKSNPPAELHPEADDDYFTDANNIELPVDIARQGDYLIIRAPMVGATNDDISITVNNDILYIHKETCQIEEAVDNYYVQECHWGPIAREVQLPVSVDPEAAKASLQDGVLKIVLPIISNRKTRIIKIRWSLN